MTAPSEEIVEREQGETGLLHKWCQRCVPPAGVATAFCGYRTAARHRGPTPQWPFCQVCMDMSRFSCGMCGR